MAVGAEFNFSKLGNTFLTPLIVSPFMAAIFSLFAYLLFNFFQKNTPSLNKENPILFAIKLSRLLDFLHYITY